MAVLCFGRVPREVVAWACLNSRARNHNGVNLLNVAVSARVRCGEHFLCHVGPCSAGSAMLSTVKPCSLTISPCHPSETCTLATQKDANAAPLACWAFAECHGVSCAAGRDSSDGTARAGRGTVWCDGSRRGLYYSREGGESSWACGCWRCSGEGLHGALDGLGETGSVRLSA